jgi:hypothetical protein
MAVRTRNLRRYLLLVIRVLHPRSSRNFTAAQHFSGAAETVARRNELELCKQVSGRRKCNAESWLTTNTDHDGAEVIQSAVCEDNLCAHLPFGAKGGLTTRRPQGNCVSSSTPGGASNVMGMGVSDTPQSLLPAYSPIRQSDLL